MTRTLFCGKLLAGDVSMKRWMIKDHILILALVIATGGWSLCCCDFVFGDQAFMTIEGRIAAIDTFKSTVTVKALFTRPIITHKNITLFIGPKTKILISGSAVSIFDLTVGGEVDVKYVEKEDIPEALSITVTNSAGIPRNPSF